MVVCSIMLASVSLMLVPAIHGAGQQRKAIRFETLTMIELGNVRQKLETTQLTGVSANLSETAMTLSAWYSRRYPASKLKVTPVAADPAAVDSSASGPQPIRLTIHQPAGPGKPDWSVSVVVWIPEAAQ